MSTAKTTYLVTGANRGIGLAIVEELSLNKDNFIIATARDPSKATALHALNAKNGNVKVVAYEGTGTNTEEDKARNAKFYNEISGHVIDVLFSNHGIATSTAPIMDVEFDDVVEHFKVNTVSPAQLVKLVLPLMEKSPVKKILFMSSLAGSLSDDPPALLLAAYGVSKAGINFFMREFYHALAPKGFKLASVHPGAVATEMLKDGLSQLGSDLDALSTVIPVYTATESGSAIVKNVVYPLSDELNGKFIRFDGVVLDF